MGQGYYAVDTGSGDVMVSGLSEHTAREVAQETADRIGETVYLYEVGSDAVPVAVEPSTATADDCEHGE